MIERLIPSIRFACLTNVSNLWTILCRKTQHARMIHQNTLRFPTSGNPGRPPRTSKFHPPKKNLYGDINETRSRARFCFSVRDPQADPTRSQKNLKIWKCELHVLVFDTRDGAETPQNNQGKRFDRLHKQNKTTRR